MGRKFKEYAFSRFTKQQIEELQVSQYKMNVSKLDAAEPRISVDESPDNIAISSDEEMNDIDDQDTFDVNATRLDNFLGISYISSYDEIMDIDNAEITDIDNYESMDIDEDEQLYNSAEYNTGGLEYNNYSACCNGTATLQDQDIYSSDEYSTDSEIIPSRGLRKRIKTLSKKGDKKAITDLLKRDGRDRYRYQIRREERDLLKRDNRKRIKTLLKRGKPREPLVSVKPEYTLSPCQFNTINKGIVNLSTIIRDKQGRVLQCCICNVNVSKNEPDCLSNLSRCCYNKKPLCKGCLQLMAIAGDETSLLDILRWFKTGTSLLHSPPADASDKELSEFTKRRAKCMRNRAKSFGIKGFVDVATRKELFDICKNNDMKCAITGHRLYFDRSDNSFLPFWKASFDHIHPLNNNKLDPTSWSAKNWQLMSSLINTIKGHMSNQEIAKWYGNIIQAKSIEL
ncbi:hypothetical protein HPULCUR_012038 [Helicostylum pulchrum]|uniref:Uncharacterized protein n=1 Tax=Helicostylum pulchrum TaxID=562976 RepID=A0ABP9YHS1_9FUNG